MGALSAFAGYGIELEYMIVDQSSLSVRPIADTLLKNAAGEIINELDHDGIGWSNELVLHVLEVKNRWPVQELFGLARVFQQQIVEINHALLNTGACLMPTAMHPWMNPLWETHLWPHENAEMYLTYDRIFGCQQHGFANLQSMHLNLPFQSDDQFARLHAAVRLILPIVPALAASSPLADGRLTGVLDRRLLAYLDHQRKVPATMGQVIPDTVSSQLEYQEDILRPMYESLVALDPEGTLRHEWLNARGVIPRFDRMALEIRLIDMQEYPLADLAIAAAISSAVKHLYEANASELSAQQGYPTEALAALLSECIRDAEQAVITDASYLELFGLPPVPCHASELWRRLIHDWWKEEPEQHDIWSAPLNVLLERGTLARRIQRAVGEDCSRAHLEELYRSLCDCLRHGRPFLGPNQ